MNEQKDRAGKIIRVRGVVQGVGFRPFVYRIALENSLAGRIGNDTDGVTIEVEGTPSGIDKFVSQLRAEAPPMSRIDAIETEAMEPRGAEQFLIVVSQVLGQVSTGIPADAATCPDCLRELLDPADRRYRYPFINCTNCGPRFTITSRIPYDRPQTSMAVFPMCPACQAEYDDPLNRRFHAQPNACAACGPHVWLETAAGERIEAEDPITRCIDGVLGGQVMAIKGIGGFHLCVDATNEAAVQRLRERKHRYGKPLAVMVKDVEAAREVCALTPADEELLVHSARPIVLARARDGNGISPIVAPGIPWLGVFLPYAPLQHLLFADARVRALVMTSANLTDEPIAIDNEEARARLGKIGDGFLMHNRAILQRCDDSVAAVVNDGPQLVRRARGYVPLAIDLPMDAAPLLAVGGHLKNVFALARGRYAFQSQHLGDLEDLTGLAFFKESLAHLTHTFEIDPQAVAHDMHPGYLSTNWAREWAGERGLPTLAVQHHHAHIASVVAEHKIDGPVIGLALDGTGYGTDGRTWGGEVLIARMDGFERFAHLEYVPMPGGDAAVKEPWRMAYAHLRNAGFSTEDTMELTGVSQQEARIVERMMERGLNAPLTSSLGRLFDAVASVALKRRKVDYDAQAAIELEGIATGQKDHLRRVEYAPTLLRRDGNFQLQTRDLWRAIVDDLQRGIPIAEIAMQFHIGVAGAFIAAAAQARTTTGIQVVAMSGGCMHNSLLSHLLRAGLEEEGFAVYENRRVSPGDGGLSYGQAAIAAAILAKS
jgi:hydrogenase maturation protein HypF